MYTKSLFIFILLIAEYSVYAQSYSCVATYSCEVDGQESSTPLFKKEYNDQNLLLKEVEYNAIDSTNPTVRIYDFDLNHKLVVAIDSNAFQKTTRHYSYHHEKLKKMMCITSTLSTENISSERLLPFEDSNRVTRPKIVYVRIIDTIIYKYQYNTKGLLIKTIIKHKDDLYESTETFEYDKQDRLTKSVFSDQYQFRYYYDATSKLIKKEKYTNTYIDDSGIGPYYKSEAERLEKVIWELSFSLVMTYDPKGNLIEQRTIHAFGSIPDLKELYTYDERGRMIESKIIENSESSLSCKTIYRYE